MAGEGEGFLPDALLQAAVADEAPDLVVDDGVGGLVVCGGEVLGGNGEAEGIGDALAEQARRELDTGELNLGMTSGDLGGGELPVFEVVVYKELTPKSGLWYCLSASIVQAS